MILIIDIFSQDIKQVYHSILEMFLHEQTRTKAFSIEILEVEKL